MNEKRTCASARVESLFEVLCLYMDCIVTGLYRSKSHAGRIATVLLDTQFGWHRKPQLSVSQMDFTKLIALVAYEAVRSGGAKRRRRLTGESMVDVNPYLLLCNVKPYIDNKNKDAPFSVIF